MKLQLSDIVDNLREHIMGAMQGDDGEQCAYYLRTSYQKCLFAEERIKSLADLVDEYKKKLDRREILDSLHLAMDYDHLLVSLRSALEYLAKLIGFTLSSGLPDTLIAHQQNFNLGEVAYMLRDNLGSSANAYYVQVLAFLNEKIEQNWYKELVEPGLVISHDKLRTYPRVSPRDVGRQLLDFRFILPDMGEGTIIAYCRNLIEQVEGVLKGVCLLIEGYIAPY